MLFISTELNAENKTVITYEDWRETTSGGISELKLVDSCFKLFKITMITFMSSRFCYADVLLSAKWLRLILFFYLVPF